MLSWPLLQAVATLACVALLPLTLLAVITTGLMSTLRTASNCWWMRVLASYPRARYFLIASLLRLLKASRCVYVCVCMCGCVCVYVCTCACMCVCTCVYLCCVCDGMVQGTLWTSIPPSDRFSLLAFLIVNASALPVHVAGNSTWS